MGANASEKCLELILVIVYSKLIFTPQVLKPSKKVISVSCFVDCVGMSDRRYLLNKDSCNFTGQIEFFHMFGFQEIMEHYKNFNFKSLSLTVTLP